MNPDGSEYNDSLWQPVNSLDVELQTLIKLKMARNADPSATVSKIYRQLQTNGQEYAV